MSIENFKPEVWRTSTEKDDVFFLVCRNRWMRGQEVKGSTFTPPEPRAWKGEFDFVAHAIAIQLTENTWHLKYINDSKHHWETMPVSAFPYYPLTTRTATAVLRIAWRAVDAGMNLDGMTMKVDFNLSNLEAKNRSGYWKITAALSWETWERSNVSLAHRAAWLRGAGFPKVTEIALRRMAEEYAL